MSQRFLAWMLAAILAAAGALPAAAETVDPEPLKPRAIKLVKDLDIPEAQRDAIFFANAARLLKLPVARAAPAA